MSTGGTDGNWERMLSDLRLVVRDAEHLLASTPEAAGAGVQEARGRLAESLTSAREACRSLESHLSDGAKVADRAIREHPYQSVGLAFGIGLLIGVLVMRRE